MEKISRNQVNFIIMTVIYDEIADQVAGKGANFRDVDEIIREMTDDPLPFKEHVLWSIPQWNLLRNTLKKNKRSSSTRY